MMGRLCRLVVSEARDDLLVIDLRILSDTQADAQWESIVLSPVWREHLLWGVLPSWGRVWELHQTARDRGVLV